MLISYSRMEKLVTLQYGNFTILGEQMKEFAQRTDCSNRVANQTLRDQLYLNELTREHPGWITTWCQEWGLFLLEHLLHNTASMRRKEHQRCCKAPWAETAKVMAPEHPSIWTLLGSTDVEILKIAEQIYWEECVVALSVLHHLWQEECIKELCKDLAQCMARAGLQGGPGLARQLLKVGDAPTAVPPHKLSLSWALGWQRQPNIQEKTFWQGNSDQEGDVPIPGVGTGWNGAGVPHPNIQAGTSHPVQAPHYHILLMSGSATPWGISTCTHDYKNPRAVHREVMLPHIPKGIFLLHRNLWRSAYWKIWKSNRSGHHGWRFGQWSYTVHGPYHLPGGGTAEEWDDTPCPSTSLPVDPPQLQWGHKCHPTHMGGAHLKVPVKLSTAWSQSQSWVKGMPDPVNHPHWWIKAEMSSLGDHPHW